MKNQDPYFIKLDPKRNNEYPIVYFWYTKHKGRTIEELIDKDVHFFEWAVGAFQNVTPKQAEYYFQKTRRKVPKEAIQDVVPYEYLEGDPEPNMYMELCETGDLDTVIKKYRGVQMSLF